MEHSLTRESGAPLDARSGLILLGTDHRDPQGFRRMRNALALLQPDAVFVEISPFALSFRQKHGMACLKALRQNLRTAAARRGVSFPDALKHPEIEAIRRQIELPFEYRAASDYVSRSRAGLFLVDQSDFSRRLIASWRELVAVDNLSILLTCSSDVAHTAKTYRRAHDAIHGRSDLQTLSGGVELDSTDGLWARRESYMAARITAALEIHRHRRPLYAGGWWHLTLDGRLPTLRRLLGVEASRCLLLDSFGNLQQDP